MAEKPNQGGATKGDAVLFDVLLLVFFLIITIVSFNYNPRARSIPLALGMLGAFMTLLQLLVDTLPSVRSKLRFISAGGVWYDEDPVASKDKIQAEPEKGSEGKRGARDWWAVLRVALWLGAFILLLVLTHYLIAVAAFVFLMARLEGRESWMRSAVLALCVVLGFFILFDVLLQAQL
jgi:uncharacterized integral membrane protein